MRRQSHSKKRLPSKSVRQKKRIMQIKKKLQKKNRRNVKLAGQSKTKFTDLNDDCIDEILRRISPVELWKFTILSKRLKLRAEEMFKRMYSSKTIILSPISYANELESYNMR